MRILVDVGVGRAVEIWLASEGHDVLALRAIDPSMPDSRALELAAHEERLVITMDKDFGRLVFRSAQSHGGVLLLRLEDARSAEKVAVVRTIFAQHGERLAQRFSVFKDGRLRIR